MSSQRTERLAKALQQAFEQQGAWSQCYGRVKEVHGNVIEVSGMSACIGQVCFVHSQYAGQLEVEVVGFRNLRTLMMPLSGVQGIALDDWVEPGAREVQLSLSPALLGQVLDAWGKPMTNAVFTRQGIEKRSLHGRKMNPIQRRTISELIPTGVRVIDTCLSLGRGQRIGLFAGAGVGKSSLLGMLARGGDAEVNVIALVGERSREVREFIEDSLGEEGLKRSVVVVATSDMPPVLRIRAARIAASIAEYFRDAGRQVFFMMDSLTRFAHAYRELSLALGEAPGTKGYTPSCFSEMATFVERAGTGDADDLGDITALYTILVEGDDMSEPVADAAKSFLDGHIVLNRALAEKGHYPAIDVLQSVSRLSQKLNPAEVQTSLIRLRKALSLYERMVDMVDMGAYDVGSNPALDLVLQHKPELDAFLQQGSEEYSSLEESRSRFIQLFEDFR